MAILVIELPASLTVKFKVATESQPAALWRVTSYLPANM